MLYLRTGIPWQVTVAQAAMETGWGSKTPIDIYSGSSSNNIFGIKYVGSPTDSSNLFVLAWTSENISDSDLVSWEKEHARWALNGEKLVNTGERDSKGKLIIKVIQPFRAFPSRDDAIIAHSQTILAFSLHGERTSNSAMVVSLLWRWYADIKDWNSVSSAINKNDTATFTTRNINEFYDILTGQSLGLPG